MEARPVPIQVFDAQVPAHASLRIATAAGALRDDPASPSHARREATYRRALATADALAAALALLVAHVAAGEPLRPVALLFLPAMVLTSKVLGLYDRDELVVNKTTLDEAPALFRLATAFAFGTWLADGDFDRAQAATMWAVLFLATFALRVLARRLAARLTPPERILFIGDEDEHEALSRRLHDNGAPGSIVGRICVSEWVANGLAGDRGVLAEIVSTLHVHRVIVVADDSESEGTLEIVRAAKGVGVRVSVLPRILEVVGSSAEFDDLYGIPVLGVRRFGLTWSSQLLKRCFDLVVATAATVLLAPLMAAVAVLIKLDTRGPVLFRQERMGREGRTFRIFKFRTMVDGADALKHELEHLNESDGLFKITDDPRITRIGRVLRRTSLDELPQLFNVLRGEMSVVGPRPLVLPEAAKIVGWNHIRLALTPGMTGPWQILGSSRVPLGEMVKIDYFYAASWSLWGDAKVLLRTVPYVLARRGL